MTKKARRKTPPARKSRATTSRPAAGSPARKRAAAPAAKKRPSSARLPAPPPPDVATLLKDQTEIISRFRADGTFTYVNEVFCRFFGKTSRELIGHTWMPQVVEEDLPMVREKLRQLTPRTPVAVIENRVCSGEGEVRWMQFVNRAFFDSRGRLSEIQSVGRDVTERKLAEEALRESEQRWKFALEGAGDGLWDWNVSTGTVIFSNRWKEMLGFEPGEIGNRFEEWSKRVHPEDLPGALAAVKMHFDGVTPTYVREFRMKCKDGGWKWILARGMVTSRDGRGRPLRAIGTHQDISARKEAEDREARNLRMIAEGAPRTAVLEAIVCNVEAGNAGVRCCVLMVDQGGLRVREVVAPGLPGFFVKALRESAMIPEMKCVLTAVRDGRRGMTEDIRAGRGKPGLKKLAARARFRSCWSEPLVGSSGLVLGAIVCFVSEPRSPSGAEISAVSAAASLAAVAIERHQDEEALRDSEERYRRIVETAEEGVWTIDAKSETDFVNPKMARMMGFTVEEMLGRPLHDFMDESMRPTSDRNVIRRKEGIAEQHEFRFRRKDGSDLWAWLSTSPILDSHGAYAGAMAMVTDISPLKQAQAALIDREARYRGIMESQIVGLIFWKLDGSITDANKAFLNMVGFTEQDVHEGRLSWKVLTPPEYKKADRRAVEELAFRGIITPFEKEYFRRDGSRVPVIIGGALFPHKPEEGVSFVLDISERKRADRALRESEERCRILADHTDDIVGLNDTEGNCLYLSPSYHRKTGWSMEEIRSTDWRVRIHPDDLAMVEAARASNLHGSPTRIEHRTLCKDGSWIWLDTNCKPLPGPDGKTRQLLVWSHDVTERRNTEQALRISEERYARAMRGTTDGLWDWNMLTGEIYLSARWKELLGFADEELPSDRQTAFLSRIHPDDRARVDAMRRDHLEEDIPYDVEMRLRTKDDRYKWFRGRGQVERDSAGRPVRMAGAITDIDEQKKAQAGYQSELDFNKALVRHTAALILVTDPAGNIVHVNPAFTRVLGYELKDIAGRSAWEIGMMDEHETARSKLRFSHLAKGMDNPPAEIWLRTAAGDMRLIEIWGTSSRDAQGEVERVIVTGIDVTDRHRLQTELLKIAEHEHARIGNDLHDGVGQTMTGIASLMEVLEGKLDGDNKALAGRIRQFTQESVQEVRRMSHGLSPSGVKNRGLDGALRLLAETVRTNYRTSCSCEIDPLVKIPDPDAQTHLFRIAQEAVNNAMRHGKPGTIGLSLKHVSNQECELRIDDDGSGMKNKTGDGEGIGIRVMDYRANLIGGSLQVKARPRGGTRIICRFPCSPAARS